MTRRTSGSGLVASLVLGAAAALLTSSASATTVTRVLLEDSTSRWWSVDPTTGTQTVTGAVGDGRYSPDGSLLASTDPSAAGGGSGEATLTITAANGSTSRNLGTVDDAYDNLPQWTSDGSAVIAAEYAGCHGGTASEVLARINVTTGNRTRIGKISCADGPLGVSPDGRLAVSASADPGVLTFTDLQTGRGAGTLAVPDLTAASTLASHDDAVYSDWLVPRWSADGRYVVVDVSIYDEPISPPAASAVVLVDLSAKKATFIAAPTVNEYSANVEFSADGSQVCWQPINFTDTSWKCRAVTDGATTLLPDLASVEPSEVAVVGQPSTIDPTPTATTSATVKPSPGAVDVTYGVKNGNGAGVVTYLRTGPKAKATAARGTLIGVNESGHIRIDRLKPATTYTVTLVGRSWSGKAGSARQVTFKTPKTPGSETSLSSSYSGKVPHVGVLVVRADTQKPAAGRKVQIIARGFGHISGPFHVVATLTTGQNGRATFANASRVDLDTLRVATLGDSHLGPSSADLY